MVNGRQLSEAHEKGRESADKDAHADAFAVFLGGDHHGTDKGRLSSKEEQAEFERGYQNRKNELKHW